MSVFVCLCVCLFASISPELHVRSSTNLSCILLMAVAQSLSSGGVIRYVLPVLWTSGRLRVAHTPNRRRERRRVVEVTQQGAARLCEARLPMLCTGCVELTTDKKLSYRRVTARCVLSVVILPNTTQQCRNYLYDKS